MPHLTWPAAFFGQQMPVSGGTQYVRVGGNGPAVLLLHGFGDTGDMWVPLAERLVKSHAVIVPDLRGMGLSSHPEDDTKRPRRPATSPQSWTSWESKKSTSLPTTSAIWWVMPSRRCIRTERRNGWSWMRPSRALAIGMIS